MLESANQNLTTRYKGGLQQVASAFGIVGKSLKRDLYKQYHYMYSNSNIQIYIHVYTYYLWKFVINYSSTSTFT